MDNQPALIEVPTNRAPEIPPGFYKNKPRPNYSSPEVLIMVVNRLMPQVMTWGKFSEDEAPEIAEQVMKALRNDSDGYQRAKYLESRFSWNSDSELVEVMESDDFYGATRDAVKAWIRDNGIKPVLGIGHQITVRIGRDDQDYVGFIRSLTEDGMYCVRIPAKGHVESGLGAQGMLFPWEDVETWNSVGRAENPPNSDNGDCRYN